MENPENACTVCHEYITIFAVGVCDHPICFRCSTRMRVLCEQMYCAICRSDLPQVVFVRKCAKYEEINRKDFIPNRKFKICFEDNNVRQIFQTLLDHKCQICNDSPPERSFAALKEHMRKEHTMFCCDLCFKHLKIFPYERKFYSRKDLATHRRLGDPDDTSYKGHSLCQFCDERYMDNDELLRHLRKDHYFCHFCDTSGSNEYYNAYEDLKNHFRSRHYLCEEGECAYKHVQFTNAFRSIIDMKAHIASEHNQGLTKAQVKEARTIDVSFQMAPRRKGRARGGISGEDYEDSGQNSRGRGHYQRAPRYDRRERDQVERAVEVSLRESLRAEEKEMREVERRRRQAEEKVQMEEMQRQCEAEMQQKEKNFPVLSASASGTASGQARSVSENVQSNKNGHSEQGMPFSRIIRNPGQVSSRDYPSLQPSSALGTSTRTVSGKRSPVNLQPAASSVATSVKSRHSPVNVQNTLANVSSSVKTEQPKNSKYFVKRTSDDFPELDRAQPALANNSVSLVSLGVWSQKSQKNDLYTDSGTTQQSSFDQVDAAFKKMDLKSAKPSLSALGKALYNTNEYPALSEKPSVKPLDNGPWVPKASSAKTKTVKSNSSKAENIVKDKPPPKTKDKKLPSELPDETKTTKKEKKKKKKLKDSEKDENPQSLSNGVHPDLKSSSDGKEASSADSGFSESSSGSLDGAAFTLVQSSKKVCSEPSRKPVQSFKTDSNTQMGLPSESSVVDDFPSLNPSSVKAPPPGFKQPVSSAPPGFGDKPSTTKPPPGFSSKPSIDDRFGFKSSPLSADFENFSFSQPVNFQERNKKLVKDVSSLLENNQDDFGQFKTLSGQFRQGNLEALGYYRSCQTLIGEEKFQTIFPELLALLPDIKKQQELLSVHTMSKRPSLKQSVLKITGKSTKSWDTSVDEFLTCPTCHQVLILKDFDKHSSQHNQFGDFPTLGSAGPYSRFLGQGSWIKAK